jgi:hypothetical protein
MPHIKSAYANIRKICLPNPDKRASSLHHLGFMASNSISASDSNPCETSYSTVKLTPASRSLLKG